MSKHDVIVVGAGSGGLVAAHGVAKAGLRVLVLDRAPRGQLGHDWCDVVEEGIFTEVGLSPPPSSMHRPTTTPAFASPSLATVLRPGSAPNGPLPFLYLDRKRWLDHLVEEVARHPNIELRDNVVVAGPLRSGTRVHGVRVRMRDGEVDGSLEASWVVDASGASAVIESQVPYLHPHAPDPVLGRDMFVAMKELLPDKSSARGPGLSQGLTDLMLPGYAGGFGWMMSYWEGIADVGIALPSDRHPNRLRREVELLKKHLGLPRVRPLRRGGGLLPARRSRTRLAGDGYVVVGDAACQVNPSNGAGIASSMRAGHLAANAIIEASRRSERSEWSDKGSANATRTALVWSYPSTYLRTEGAAFAALDALRVHFQRFAQADLEVGFASGLISHRDLITPFLDAAIPTIGAADVLERGLRGARHPWILARLLRALSAAHRVKRLYRRVPTEYDVKAIARWEQRIHHETSRW